MKLTISGALSPDATIANTGEPTGQYLGRDQWTWAAGGHAWTLRYVADPFASGWKILADGGEDYWWAGPNAVSPVGEYSPALGAGAMTISEHTGADAYATLVVNEGPLAGMYIILKANDNDRVPI